MGENMIAISIYVKGGVAYVMGGSEGVSVKLEDTDSGETDYYYCEGAGNVFLREEGDSIIPLIEEELKCLGD